MGVLRGSFQGFWCPKRHPDALLAKTMTHHEAGFIHRCRNAQEELKDGLSTDEDAAAAAAAAGKRIIPKIEKKEEKPAKEDLDGESSFITEKRKSFLK